MGSSKERDSRGRKGNLTQEVIDDICKGVRLGLTFKDAAEFAGVPERTFWHWKLKADNARGGLYGLLLQSLKKAVSQAKALHLKRIHEASAGGKEVTETRVTKNKAGEVVETVTVTKTLLPVWQASAWILERRHADEFGRHIPAPMGETDKDPMDKWIDDLNKAAAEYDGE